MRKLERGTRLVVASHNRGKIREINDLIRPYGLTAASAGELGISEPEETEATFAGNARLKQSDIGTTPAAIPRASRCYHRRADFVTLSKKLR